MKMSEQSFVDRRVEKLCRMVRKRLLLYLYVRRVVLESYRTVPHNGILSEKTQQFLALGYLYGRRGEEGLHCSRGYRDHGLYHGGRGWGYLVLTGTVPL